MATVSAALPWLDQLHNIIASMYVNGGLHNRCAGLHRNIMVQVGDEICFENPIVSYAGVGEVERSFQGRQLSQALMQQTDVKTVLECIDVKASDDSICGGEIAQQLDGILPLPLPNPSKTISSSPPKVEVTYRLSQQYGSFFTMHSILVVTVQVRRGSSQKVRNIIPGGKVALPLATSGFTPRAASTVAVAATNHSGALSKAASKIVARATNNSKGGGIQNSDNNARGGQNAPQIITSPTPQPPLFGVAEVVRIEERWRGVQLLQFAPWHLSRRLNGLVVGSISYFLFN